MRRVNVGCGMSPTIGWTNFDNSFSIKLSKYPFLASLLFKIKLVNPPQMDYIRFCQSNNVDWADAVSSIPLPNNSVQVLYSSHMLEHLDREEAALFLREARRVLAPDGKIRLAVPDIGQIVNTYNTREDADALIESMHVCISRPRTLLQKVKVLIIGARHHQWMYDGKSLSRLLEKEGFSNPVVLRAGETTIGDPEPLDLYERSVESVYVEAGKE